MFFKYTYSMIILHIVRHGETDYNKQARYLGRTDLPLNSAGRHQAKELAQKIDDFRINIVVSSPLKRTMETAQIIAPDKEIISNDNFIERSLGVYEGLTKQEAKQKYPDLYHRVITRIYNEAPPQGETIEQIENRVFKGLDEFKRKYQGKNILLITHAFIAKVINKYFFPNLLDDNFFNFVLPLAGVERYILK